tara:strand:+ start:647 stop:880 length:234 start_codon:yes stop_codon:yes gene_type:complete
MSEELEEKLSKIRKEERLRRKINSRNGCLIVILLMIFFIFLGICNSEEKISISSSKNTDWEKSTEERILERAKKLNK